MGERRPSIPVPSVAEPRDPEEDTEIQFVENRAGPRRPYIVRVVEGTGPTAHPVDGDGVTIGRGKDALIRIVDSGVSRLHANIRCVGDFCVLEDTGSANGTRLNGARIDEAVALREGDKIQIGTTLFRFAMLDEDEERMQQQIARAISGAAGPEASARTKATDDAAEPWSPESWRKKPVAQAIHYEDAALLEATIAKLRRLPPLVTSWEIEDLKRLIAEAQEGRRFFLQGGDCAETLADCDPGVITDKLKILIQMSLVLIRGTRRPVIRVGRFAGQYAKPRSRATEVRDGKELPSYFGDLINRPAFDEESRRPDPNLLLQGYLHAAVTLNFIRALSGGGFADLRRPEYFDLSFFERAELPTNLREGYAKMCREITSSLEMMQAFGDRSADELMKITFYTSHEGLNLPYEAAQTRRVPRRSGYYDLTTHLPWIGERTRLLDGAHVELFRGIANPIAVKLGPTATPEEVVALCKALNPQNERGKLVLITRMGTARVAKSLPPLIEGVRRHRLPVLWVSDPMHGNTLTTRSGRKTRDFDDILNELEQSIDVHQSLGSYLGGVHFELTGEDVTECIGSGVSEQDLSRNYGTLCDPRLNYRQAIEMAFALARRLNETARPPSTIPPPAR